MAEKIKEIKPWDQLDVTEKCNRLKKITRAITIRLNRAFKDINALKVHIHDPKTGSTVLTDQDK